MHAILGDDEEEEKDPVVDQTSRPISHRWFQQSKESLLKRLLQPYVFSVRRMDKRRLALDGQAPWPH